MHGGTVTTEPNACVFYSPGTPQWFHSDTPLVHDWAHTDKSLKYQLQKYGIEENKLYYPKDCGFITEIFKETENEWFSERRFKKDCTENLFAGFLIRFSRSVSEEYQPRIDSEESRKFSEVRTWIMMELDRRWTVEQMAELAGLSPSRFHTQYRRIFGTTPMNDLILARIDAAKNRLSSSGSPVYIIADELGYSNQYHFIRQFSSIAGCSPTEYRKKALK